MGSTGWHGSVAQYPEAALLLDVSAEVDEAATPDEAAEELLDGCAAELPLPAPADDEAPSADEPDEGDVSDDVPGAAEVLPCQALDDDHASDDVPGSAELLPRVDEGATAEEPVPLLSGADDDGAAEEPVLLLPAPLDGVLPEVLLEPLGSAGRGPDSHTWLTQ